MSAIEIFLLVSKLSLFWETIFRGVQFVLLVILSRNNRLLKWGFGGVSGGWGLNKLDNWRLDLIVKTSCSLG